MKKYKFILLLVLVFILFSVSSCDVSYTDPANYGKSVSSFIFWDDDDEMRETVLDILLYIFILVTVAIPIIIFIFYKSLKKKPIAKTIGLD